MKYEEEDNYEEDRYEEDRYGDRELYIGKQPESTNKIFVKCYDMYPNSDGMNGERNVLFVENEVLNHITMAKLNIAPKFYGYGYCENGIYLSMKKINGLNYTQLWYKVLKDRNPSSSEEYRKTILYFLETYYKQVIPMLHRLFYKISNWDKRLENIMFDFDNNRAYIIDYGYSFPD